MLIEVIGAVTVARRSGIYDVSQSAHSWLSGEKATLEPMGTPTQARAGAPAGAPERGMLG